jgi:hypothetical protein
MVFLAGYTEPVEVRLSQPAARVLCALLVEVEDAGLWELCFRVKSLSMRGAQRELTSWLLAEGYEPAGRWTTTPDETRRRMFRRPVPDLNH